MNRIGLLLPVTALVACAHPAPVREGPPGIRVDLRYAVPARRGPPLGAAFAGETSFAQFVDRRIQTRPPYQLGVAEEDTPSTPVITSVPVVDYVGHAFRDEVLDHLPVAEAADPARARRLVQGELQDFWCSETQKYMARAQIRILVTDRASRAMLFDRTVLGQEWTFGSSQSPENYAQVLNGALRKAILLIVEDPAFQRALGGSVR